MNEFLQPTCLPRITPKDLPHIALAMARSGLALMLYGSPGTGKTALIQGLGSDPGLIAWSRLQHGCALDHLPVVTLSAPELNVEDLLGVPTVEELVRHAPDGTCGSFKVTRWATPEVLDPSRPFILFIDEPNRCDPSVRNALFQLITGRATTGGFCLPKGSFVCMAGNRAEDRAGVRTLDTAFSNRCGHFELMVDHEAWLDWAGHQTGFSPLVRAFIARHPGQLCRFDPGCPYPQQPTPRTWAGVGFALQDVPLSLAEALLQGLVGLESAQTFGCLQRAWDAIPTLEQVLHDPHDLPLPGEGDLDRAWILATVLGDHLASASGMSSEFPDPVGRAVGTVFARIAEAGFEEVVVFSLRNAWKRIQPSFSPVPSRGPSMRYLSAVEVLTGLPGFQGFLTRALETPDVA